MRIKITMQALGREPSLPLDNHPFAALIYNLIGAADYGTAVFLHEEGVQAAQDRKRFKPFVFSRLHLGSECGFGKGNSKGFSMVWAVR